MNEDDLSNFPAFHTIKTNMGHIRSYFNFKQYELPPSYINGKVSFNSKDNTLLSACKLILQTFLQTFFELSYSYYITKVDFFNLYSIFFPSELRMSSTSGLGISYFIRSVFNANKIQITINKRHIKGIKFIEPPDSTLLNFNKFVSDQLKWIKDFVNNNPLTRPNVDNNLANLYIFNNNNDYGSSSFSNLILSTYCDCKNNKTTFFPYMYNSETISLNDKEESTYSVNDSDSVPANLLEIDKLDYEFLLLSDCVLLNIILPPNLCRIYDFVLHNTFGFRINTSIHFVIEISFEYHSEIPIIISSFSSSAKQYIVDLILPPHVDIGQLEANISTNSIYYGSTNLGTLGIKLPLLSNFLVLNSRSDNRIYFIQ